jgi:uncharacterized protein YceK
MRGKLTICGAAGLAVALVGCGTVANTVWLAPYEGGQKIFGGVRVDVAAAKGCFEEASRAEDSADRLKSGSKAVAFGALDLPLSLVADTLTLPYTISATLLRGETTGHDIGSPPPAARPGNSGP